MPVHILLAFRLLILLSSARPLFLCVCQVCFCQQDIQFYSSNESSFVTHLTCSQFFFCLFGIFECLKLKLEPTYFKFSCFFFFKFWDSEYLIFYITLFEENIYYTIKMLYILLSNSAVVSFVTSFKRKYCTENWFSQIVCFEQFSFKI